MTPVGVGTRRTRRPSCTTYAPPYHRQNASHHADIEMGIIVSCTGDVTSVEESAQLTLNFFGKYLGGRGAGGVQ